MMILVAKTKPEAILPTRAHAQDAGLDLYTPTPVRMENGQTYLLSTGIAVDIPEKHVGLVLGRSSLNLLKIDATVGVIDSGYIGEIGVLLTNNSGKPIAFDSGTRVAQLVILPIVTPEVFEVSRLVPTERGLGSFGSTGA